MIHRLPTPAEIDEMIRRNLIIPGLLTVAVTVFGCLFALLTPAPEPVVQAVAIVTSSPANP